ncbi:TNF receptor-associated factor 2-like isoform X1 [Amphiura filiformis]|uniref:TNF receptor-associated factor 2-like isoform X1 n=2 Tax=Amphiura filiformis TaxID=82378 RepID=UPI003B228F5A
MPGYKREALITSQKFPSHLQCVICKLLLRSPVQTVCGHRFCETCVKSKLETRSENEEPKCPVCPDEEGIFDKEKIYPDFHARKELKTLHMQCVNDGCNWKGSFTDYTEHEAECEFELIKCLKAGCGKSLRRADLAYHLEKDCPMRSVRCRNCGEEEVYKNMKTHNSICPKAPVTCENCRKKLTRDTIKSHQDQETGDCPNKTHHCPYAPHGCTFTTPGVDGLKNHLQDEIIYHTLLQKGQTDDLVAQLNGQLEILNSYKSLGAPSNDEGTGAAKASASSTDKQVEALVPILKQLFVTRAENDGTEPNNFKTSVSHTSSSERPSERQRGTEALDKKIRGLESKVKKLEQDTSNLTTLYAVLDKRNETFQEVVAVLNNQLEVVSEKANGLERENKHLKDIIELQEKQIHAHDQMLTVKNVALAEQELRIQTLESSAFNGILIWKITEYTRRRNEALSGKTTSFYSHPFFTSYHGYKMRARIYLNGDGMGKGTHVSLFFVVMKGQYDNILHWPFRQKVTFMMVDQGNREHVVDSFRPDPTSSSFKKPVNEMNIASGCPLFVNLNQLQSNDYAYVKDDCLFVKVIVDVSDLERM